MGQSALILSLAVTLTIIMILIVVAQTTKDADVELAQYHYKVLARELSSTGLNLTVRRLVDEPYRWSDSTWGYAYPETPHSSGVFRTTVRPIGSLKTNFLGVDKNTVDVVSTGIISNSGGDITHVIEARYVKSYEDFGLPPAFRKAMFADSVLSLGGNIVIKHTNVTANASLHGNDGLTAGGALNEVFGYGTVSNDPQHVGEMDDIALNAEAIFYPPDIVDGQELVAAGAPLHLPPLEASAIDAAVHSDPHIHVFGSGANNEYVLSSDTLRLADYPPGYGTADQPLLYYVDGNLVVQNMVVEGYVQFVVTGDIEFGGSTTVYVDGDLDGHADPEPSESDSSQWEAWMQGQLNAAHNTTVAFFAEGEVHSHGDFTLVGQFYANGDVDFRGGVGNSMNLIGGVSSSRSNVAAGDGINFRFATLSVHSLPASLHYTVPEGIRLIAYAEW